MKRTLLIASVVLALLAIMGAGYLMLSRTLPDDGTEPVGTGPAFPSSGSLGTDTTVSVAAQEGGTIQAQDFIHDGVTVEDPANPGNYYLAGINDHCADIGSCPPGAPASDFTIVYFSEDRSFVIALTQEPLGAARAHAEAFLMDSLGISREEMCSLDYYLSTDGYVSTQYAGTNLGFSFCSGATVLP